MDIVISDATTGHTLVDMLLRTIPVVIWWSEPLDGILSPLQMRSEGRKSTIGIAYLGRNLCPSHFRHTVHCSIGRIEFWLSVQR